MYKMNDAMITRSVVHCLACYNDGVMAVQLGQSICECPQVFVHCVHHDAVEQRMSWVAGWNVAQKLGAWNAATSSFCTI